MPTSSRAPARPEPELRYVTEDTARAYVEAVDRGFHNDYAEEHWDLDRRWLDWERNFGFTAGDRWVATSGANARVMTVPGGTVPTAGVTVVTVAPDFRRRGLLTAMMKHQLEDVAHRKEPVALLWASEALIYGRFGYGSCAPMLSLSGQTRSTRFLDHVDLGDGWAEEVEQSAALDLIRPVRERLLPDRPGALDRPDVWWERQLFDPTVRRNGASGFRYVVHRTSAGDIDGYAQFRIKGDWDRHGPAGQVRISELEASGAARAALWRYLLDLDLVRTFDMDEAPLDEPLRYLVADQRAIRTEVSDGTYARIVDVPRALEARRYATDLDVVIGLTDPIFAKNQGNFRIEAAAGEHARITRARRKPDLTMNIRELGAIYLGGVSLRALHGAGLVAERAEGSVAAITRAFEWDRLPFCPDHF